MAKKSIVIVGSFVAYVAAILIGVLLAVGLAWGMWVMFVGWGLNNDGHRLMIIGTSVFWVSFGGFLWLLPKIRR